MCRYVAFGLYDFTRRVLDVCIFQQYCSAVMETTTVSKTASAHQVLTPAPALLDTHWLQMASAVQVRSEHSFLSFSITLVLV